MLKTTSRINHLAFLIYLFAIARSFMVTTMQRPN